MRFFWFNSPGINSQKQFVKLLLSPIDAVDSESFQSSKILPILFFTNSQLV